jgi:hypothetical protein
MHHFTFIPTNIRQKFILYRIHEQYIHLFECVYWDWIVLQKLWHRQGERTLFRILETGGFFIVRVGVCCLFWVETGRALSLQCQSRGAYQQIQRHSALDAESLRLPTVKGGSFV